MEQPQLLIIDDEPDIIYMVKAIGDLESWQVLGTTDGNEGLRMLKEHDFDLLLVDYYMPEMDGLKVVKKVRLFDRTLSIIVLTIDERYDTAQQFFAAGADDYAVKPIQTVDLISRIRVHLKKKGSRLGVFEQLTLPKGMSLPTLDLIHYFLQQQKTPLSIVEISEKTGLAYQTIHRYLNFFEENNLVSVTQEYGQVGRPLRKYLLK